MQAFFPIGKQYVLAAEKSWAGKKEKEYFGREQPPN